MSTKKENLAPADTGNEEKSSYHEATGRPLVYHRITRETATHAVARCGELIPHPDAAWKYVPTTDRAFIEREVCPLCVALRDFDRDAGEAAGRMSVGKLCSVATRIGVTPERLLDALRTAYREAGQGHG